VSQDKQKYGYEPNQMTTNQAKEMMDRLRTTNDPTIKQFNDATKMNALRQMMRRLLPLRGPEN
jgi:hypothetical protein